MNNKKNIHKNPVDLTPTLPVKEFSITKLFSAYSYIYSPDYQFRGESHEAIELICINQGEVTIILDDKEFILKKHQMFLHKPWDFHKIKANNVSCHAFFLSFAVDDETVPICSIGIVKKKKRRNRFGYAVLRYNYLVLKSFNYLSSFSVILFRTLQSKPFSEFIG